MAEIKSREELVRLVWLAELRRQGHRQCFDSYENDKGGVCALGLLREAAFPERWGDRVAYDDVADVGMLAGLTEAQADDVASRNDGIGRYQGHQHTFAEIADVVADWFPGK